ncbi:uncharacterized protein Z520_06744 [Fonsecaea multimorphosa CBS 102226]|uniref:Transcription factor domain-containing protein n=1 Tax=Fonsecaea multimorphosa CBS 102226 TaxID=1442371 RepID=A0A0D2JUZ0_9EURO|nr:uncharacterized protein Z520_06744 [Fonsecaea multimorphosa CBS 102226]KIX97292.1 hypothetical protein Z520_06744 [Fonsecaea multimorphosa CBS 102226]OAL23259.1 hypothetical protein AYO22_06309 [Fonsecaea multimorphosa]
MDVLDQNSAQFEFATFNSIKGGAQGAGSNKAPFLFIVKTPTSGALSRSTTRSAAASINSHAQRWAQEAASSKAIDGSSTQRQTDTLLFEKCLTRCRVSRLLDDPNKPSKGRRSANAKQTSHITTKRVKKLRRATSESRSVASDKDTSTSPEPESRRRQDSSEDEYLDNDAIQLLLGPSPGPGQKPVVDPFDCTASTIDSDILPILQYFLSFALLSTPRGDDGQRPPDAVFAHHFSSIDAIIQGCMRKSVHMYALLAATASRMRRVSGISFRAGSGPELYLHKALQCLRLLLDSQSAAEDRQIILDIYYLSVCGWYMENYGESKTHFNILKHFWKTLTPGQSTLDRYIYDMLSYNAIFLESDATNVEGSMVTPELLCPSTGSGKIYQSLGWHPRRIYSPHHCSAFPAALEQTTYSPDLKNVVQELPSLVWFFDHFHQNPDFIGPETDWVLSKSKFLVLRLLEIPSYGGELCCRLALVLLLQHISQSTLTKFHCTDESIYSSSASEKRPPIGPALITQRLKHQLQYEMLQPSKEVASGVDSAPQSTSGTHVTWTGRSDRMLLWILITGLFGARNTDQKEEHRWFWTQAVALMRVLSIGSVKLLKELMNSFVWVQGMLDDQALEELFKLGSVSDEKDGK